MDTNITEISDITDIDLSPGVIEKFLDELPDKLFRFGFKLVIAIIVLAIGLQLIKPMWMRALSILRTLC